jgi:curved DNA-binding protein CbpA
MIDRVDIPAHAYKIVTRQYTGTDCIFVWKLAACFSGVEDRVLLPFLSLITMKVHNASIRAVLSVLVVFNVLLVAGEYQNHYKILKIDKSATDAEIKKAFRELSKEFHPDKQEKQKSPEELEFATEQFLKVTKAKTVLTDKEKRAQFDEDLELGLMDDDDEGGNILDRQRKERQRERLRSKRGGFWGLIDTLSSYAVPLFLMYGFFNALSGGAGMGNSQSAYAALLNSLGLEKLRNFFGGVTVRKPKHLPNGTKVIVHSLKNRVDLNGKSGTLSGFNKDNGRYKVDFEFAGVATSQYIRNLNLRPVDISPGDKVLICNLSSACEYNGKMATVQQFKTDTNRYQIKLDGEEKELDIKVENLTATFPGGGRNRSRSNYGRREGMEYTAN